MLNRSLMQRGLGALAACWLALVLVACGGGQSGTEAQGSGGTGVWPPVASAVVDPPAEMLALMRPQPQAAMAVALGATAPAPGVSVAATTMANQFFDLLELKLPDLFPGHSTTQTEDAWLFRAYFRVGVMVGINAGKIYVLGGVFGSQLRYVAMVTDFIAPVSESTVASGVVSKGPLAGSSVCAYAITNAARGALLGSCVTSGSDGAYSVDLGAYTGPVLFEATGGTYVDEATGATVTLAAPLRSMLANASGATVSVAITPLTELAYQLANGAGGSLSTDRITSSIARVQTNFGVADIVATQPVNALSVPTTATTAQKTYALALATVSQYQKGRAAGTSLATVVQTLQTCLASPSTGCGTGSDSVAAALNRAADLFASTHPALAGLVLPVANFGALQSSDTGGWLSMSPSALTFVQQTPGTVSPVQVVTLTNTGSTTLTGFGVSFYFPSDFTQSTTCGSSLAAGATCTIAVSFSPAAYTTDGLGSTRATTAMISSNKGQATVGFYGTVGPLPRPSLQVSPASLSFPATAVGSSSAAQSVTLTNTGQAPLDFTCLETPPINGASNCYVMHADQLTLPRDYSMTTTCTFNANLSYPPTGSPPFIVAPQANLAPGQSCTVSVVFKPSTTGARNGTLIIDSNASSGANVVVPLSGNGGADASGTGTFSGIVLDAVTNQGLAGITVTISSGSTVVATVTTDATGVFTTTLPVGTYSLVMSKSGYVTATVAASTLQRDQTTTVETVLQVSSANTGTGTASGVVKNAFTGLGLSGVSLKFRSGINATTGTVLATVTSGSGGTYSLATLTSGSYTVEASLNGYTTGYFTVTVVGGLTKSNQNGTITPTLATGQTRIVLTWGATPSDLDSHLTGPSASGGSRFHVFYSSKGSQAAAPYAALDVDDTTAYGPETTTVYQQASGVYRFSVHNYSNSGSTSSSVLSASGAQVKVYLANGSTQSFQVPVGRTGTLWTVFELNGSTLTPINTMTNASSSSSIQ
ncbi:MAG: choice-of-anchor D domain-containing protein [Rhodoferax sp.]|nr:choice-of-anchor D domain-containing protein [Rhodoferax sp.]